VELVEPHALKVFFFLNYYHYSILPLLLESFLGELADVLKNMEVKQKFSGDRKCLKVFAFMKNDSTKILSLKFHGFSSLNCPIK